MDSQRVTTSVITSMITDGLEYIYIYIYIYIIYMIFIYSQSYITDGIGKHEVLLPVNQNYNIIGETKWPPVNTFS